MKGLAFKALVTISIVFAAISAIAIVATPVVYWLTEGFTRW